MIELLAWGALVLVTIWATSCDRDLAWIGGALALGWLVSNALVMWAPLSWQVAGYTGIEVIVAASVIMALAWHGLWQLKLILVLNMLSIAANLTFALYFSEQQQQVLLWKWTTNLIFAGECLLAIGAGVSHGLRSGRFHRRVRHRGDVAASHLDGPKP